MSLSSETKTTYTSSLDIYESLLEKMVSIAKHVEESGLTKEEGADILVGLAIPDVAEDLGVGVDKVKDIFTSAMFPTSPWYSFYHGFVFPMDRTNRSLEEDPPKKSTYPGYVYVIEDSNSGLYKIGKTTDANVRLSNLNRNLTPQAKPYKLLFSVRVPDYSSEEEKLHERYDALREEPEDGQGSEWFALGEKDVQYIHYYLIARNAEL